MKAARLPTRNECLHCWAENGRFVHREPGHQCLSRCFQQTASGYCETPRIFRMEPVGDRLVGATIKKCPNAAAHIRRAA